MKSNNTQIRLAATLSALTITLATSGSAFAVDDGARAYWKGRDGSTVMSVQYLNLSLQATDSKQFAPGQYIYPDSDVEADIMIASWARHMTLFNRPSSFAVNLTSGTVDVDAGATIDGQLVPPEAQVGTAFSQSSSGYADPIVQLDINLLGTPPLKSTVDLLNYEPVWTVDTAVMIGIPVGEYDEDKLVNMGLNRWYGRVALPIKYHFGAFSPGYMSSFEITPSVWLFAENDDFLGQEMENDPLLQLEMHLTQDFTPSFYGSIDLLYRSGFQSEIDGVEVGDEVDIGDFGFTLNFQATDNLAIRSSYSSNVFGDSDVDNSVIRMQLIYAWHPLTENQKKLSRGH
jgi:hypothetical protein